MLEALTYFGIRLRGVGAALGLTAALAVGAPPVARAAAGDLDGTFGGDGRVAVDVGRAAFDGEVLTQRDGRIVAFGYSYNGDDPAYTIARLARDGSRDRTFGGGDGVVIHNPTRGEDFTVAGAIQPDGKILVLGARFGERSGYTLVRYRRDGSLDRTFGGGDATVLGSFGAGPEADIRDLALQRVRGGLRIVVLGNGEDGDSVTANLARYALDGAVDRSFGRRGRAATRLGEFESAAALAVQPDGKLVVVGDSEGSGGQGTLLLRYTARGAPDRSFGRGGRVADPTGGGDVVFASDALVQRNGRIVVAGTRLRGGSDSGDFALLRYKPDGARDRTFGSGGRRFADVDRDDLGESVALATGGRLLVVGSSSDFRAAERDGRTARRGPVHPSGGGGPVGGAVNLSLARFTPSGARDAAFGGGDGEVVTRFAGDSFGFGVAVLPDGRVVASGYQEGDGYDLVVARYRSK